MNRRSRLAQWSLSAGLILVAVFIVTWVRIHLIDLGYRINQQAKQERILMEENNKLRLKLATLKSPGRLQKMAAERFGLAAPRRDQLIVVTAEHETKSK